MPGLLKQVVALLQSERWLGLELRAVLQLQVRVVVELHLRLEARPDVQARAVLRQTQGRQQVGTTCNEVVLCRWTDSLLVSAASERQRAVVAPTCATAVRTHAHIARSYMYLRKKAFAMRCSAAAIETHAQMRCSASMRIVATIDTTDGNDNDTDDIVAGYRTPIC